MSGWQARFLRSTFLVMAGVFTFFAATVPARAALGGDIASVQADQIHMQGTRTMRAAQSYTVHEIQAASGTTVREYVSAQGKVFGVAFNGPFLPDMRPLLGSYFEQYSEALRSQNGGRSRGRRAIMVNEPGLTVLIGGHPRSFSGKAYVPEMLPTGVNPEDIQ